MKKIFGLVLALVMIVSVIAVVPAFADGSDGGKWNVMLNEGINLNYYEGDVKVDTVKVAAKEMAASQTVSGKTTSVQEYLTDLTTGDYGENTKALAQALLNYGAAAYEYFAANKGYVGTPVDGEPVDSTDALLAAEAPEIDVEDPNGIFIGASLVLDGTMQLRFYFEGTGLEAEYQDNNQTSIDKDGYCYFDALVMPYTMSESVTIVVGDATVTYAPINYLQAKADDATLSEMVASIYAYGVAAEAYYVSDGCEHGGAIVIEIVSPSTIISAGKQNNICEICGNIVSTTETEKSSPTTETFTDESSGKWIIEGINVYDLLEEGQHFYPTEDDPNGNDLFLEFSFLWNESLANTGADNTAGRLTLGTLGTKDASNTKNIFYLLLKNDVSSMYCKYAGGFESTTSKYIDYGPSIPDAADTKGGYVDKLDYPLIGDYGWHRIGIQYHQVTNESGNNIGKSDLEVTLYVDGVKLSTYDTIKTSGESEFYLYRAWKDDNGNVKYQDQLDKNKTNLHVLPFLLADCGANDGTEMNVSFADIIVSVGHGFKLNVTPVTDATVDADLNEKVFFEIAEGDFCTHNGTTYDTVVREAFTALPGIMSGVCPKCGKTVTQTKRGAVTDYWNINTSSTNTVNDKYKIADALKGGKHFYPTEDNPEGNDLLVEWTFTWYEGCLAYLPGDQGDKMLLASIGNEYNQNRSTPFYFVTRDGASTMWCEFEGGFVTDANGDAIIEGPKNPDGSTNKADYVFIGGEGAHRIGIRIHQDAAIVNGAVEYTCIAYLYLDGDMISSFYFEPTDENRIFTAEIADNGEDLIYSDIGSDRYVSTFKIDNRAATSGTNFLMDADIFVTCGKDFVMQVKSVENPTPEYCFIKGKKFPSTPHFRVVVD